LKVDDHPRWGKMTAKKMVRHLGCAYEVALGERVAAPVEGFPPVLAKWVALRLPLRWPKNLSTTHELKRAVAENSDCPFDVLVKVAIGKAQAVATGTHFAPTHPMFGPMTAEDWMRWGYLHADHHLRQFGR
jgi:hypothetical protein